MIVIRIICVCVVCEGAAMANLGHQASHATQIFIFSRASHNWLNQCIRLAEVCKIS